MATFLAFTQAISALLTPVIAAIVTYIAYRQYDTARAKLALDLFEKRLAVYQRLRDAVAVVNSKGQVDTDADRLLLEAINASQFCSQMTSARTSTRCGADFPE